MLLRTSRNHDSQLATRGLTLVEMLISMAVTLLMMAAVVNLFANVGAGVRNRNASMELGNQLRSARARLFKDLAGATCAARPKLPSDDHDDGYIELIEGPFSDKNPSLLTNGFTEADDPELDFSTSIIPSSNLGAVNTDARGLGDYDDILALTVRSESEPFVGRSVVWDGANWGVTTIESNLAEVIWFAVENPADGTNGEPGMRTVYRRLLLIAPWVSELPSYPTDPNALQPKDINLDRTCYQLSDVSFRREGNIRVPNTLSDLTKRENRFGHLRNIFPHAMDLSAIRNNLSTDRNNFPEYIVDGDGNPLRPVLHPFGLPFEWDEDVGFDETNEIPTSPPGETFLGGTTTKGDDRQGEDAILNDVLAFDLRVFDPGAPLRRNPQPPTGGPDEPFTTLEPSDAGWDAAVGVKIGFGSYVDMGWLPTYAWATGEPTAYFSQRRQAGWTPWVPPASLLNGYPCVYDTWPYHYEDDGLDQDAGADNGAGVDQGTNGLDDIVPYDHDNDPSTAAIFPASGVNGVDDHGERETVPPYNVPLRGIQVKLRVYDRDTRQIRESTVTRSFVPQ